jgi:hypothetical protein
LLRKRAKGTKPTPYSVLVGHIPRIPYLLPTVSVTKFPSAKIGVKWVVAGGTYADAYIAEVGQAEIGEATGNTNTNCTNKMNDFPAWRVYNASFDWLHRWVRKGQRPPAGHPLEVGGLGGQQQKDERGNPLGGIRLPDMQVPIATYTSSNSGGDPTDFMSLSVCSLGGSVIPFTEQQLLQLYPTHQDYVDKYTKAADKAIADGYLLYVDRKDAVDKAKSAPIPN